MRWRRLAMADEACSTACLLISQRRVIARSMDVKSIPAVPTGRFRVTNTPRLVPRRSAQRASLGWFALRKHHANA